MKAQYSALFLSLSLLPHSLIAQGTYLSDPNDTSSQSLVVAPGGNIGIGTAQPEAKLDVRGLLRGESIQLSGSIGIGGIIPNSRLHVRSEGNPVAARFESDSDMCLIRLKANGPSGRQYSISSDSGAFSISDPDRGDRLFIDTEGQVGIGTTRPQAKLDVLGLVRGESLQLSGNIGIGGIIPNSRLHVRSEGNSVAARFESDKELCIIRLKSGGAQGRQYSMGIEDGGFGIGDPDRGERLFIDTEGQVGIGTTKPQAKLDVAGMVRAESYEITSNRDAKQGMIAADPDETLRQVLALPISTWSYTNAPTVRHIGPMAQDFHARFGVGSDDKHIATVDADGVALAAIQGLHTLIQEKDARIAALEQELKSMRTDLAVRLSTLETMLAHAAQDASSATTQLAATR
ncbi:MAG: tail fiber domain-containing protein [Verrucomicrobiales bacterium]|nr:tail fiber domain-containing protein [Verrucomicrobiales bacterium]